MKILLTAVEVAPIIKLGGLGDVIGSLPIALEKLDIDVDVIVPFFPFAKTDDLKVYKSFEIEVPYAGEVHRVEVYKTKLPGSTVDVLLLKSQKFFGDHNKTWKPSNEEELVSFTFFNRAVVEYIKSTFNTYDLVHCNDWHTGLITHLLSDELETSRPATLFTIHNLMYQGIGDPSIVRNVGIVPGIHQLVDWDVADGDLNMVQQGVTSADFINAVSPTYAKEIMTPEYGGTLVDILKAREGRVVGILNGINYSSFPRDYSESNWKEKKKSAKKAILDELHLDDDVNKPLYAFVGRLDPYQKGLDLIYGAIETIVNEGGNFILLGDGDAEWRLKFEALGKHPKLQKNFSAQLLFDQKLAERIYAGSDFLIVPSRYEPCGLIQMIAMWYGSIPIVRATGGLKDSVIEGKTGFIFEKYDVADLIKAIKKANEAYKGQGFGEMVDAAMRADFSWEKSAMDYKNLYNKVIQLRLKSL